MAHDFNKLLTIINGYSEFMVQNLPVGNPGRKMAAEILKAGERSAAFTGQLLAFSRHRSRWNRAPKDRFRLPSDIPPIVPPNFGSWIDDTLAHVAFR